MTIALVVIAVLWGALYSDQVQYRLSQLATTVRRSSPMVGNWKLSYLRDGETVTETIRVYAAFADVAFGDLEARLRDGSVARYKVRLEQCFGETFSVYIKPRKRPYYDISSGIVTLDLQNKTATGRIVGLSRYRAEEREGIYLREIKGVKV